MKTKDSRGEGGGEGWRMVELTMGDERLIRAVWTKKMKTKRFR